MPGPQTLCSVSARLTQDAHAQGLLGLGLRIVASACLTKLLGTL